ncbi:uncharacterized protein LDX57_006294 [Aspergillus melleus]|uniref:uncharacterized protein n=1 Tax=Aspergillus melleus TaxID=138277 RepID=UPI001E8CC502|nr:uncharacterized protein LDX57_006294 [Aspergillus melleus]KAH8428598.1 hypothetical protein LDX57_006294 [Aspergillus melleus]
MYKEALMPDQKNKVAKSKKPKSKQAKKLVFLGDFKLVQEAMNKNNEEIDRLNATLRRHKAESQRRSENLRKKIESAEEASDWYMRQLNLLLLEFLHDRGLCGPSEADKKRYLETEKKRDEGADVI